jgi:hypothetical protein
MRNLIAFITCGIAKLIPPPPFSNVTFWKSRNGKYLYYCMSDVHIDKEQKFIKIFPEAVRISQIEFDVLIRFRPDIKVIEVGDAAIVDDPFEDESAPDDDDNFEPCDRCDLPDACRDFGCAIKSGIKKDTGA